MIAFLSGTVLKKTGRSLVINVHGVGYEVFVTAPFLADAEEQDPLQLFIYTQVREDILQLIGFPTYEEWMFFKLLITVSGVGPRMALELMSAPLPKIKQAIVGKDVAALTLIPGIGKKTAERIIVELQEKIDLSEHEKIANSDAAHGAADINDEIVEAITRLGYRREHITRVLRNLPPELKKEEDIIKYFLQNV